jgi:hypothetical protein
MDNTAFLARFNQFSSERRYALEEVLKGILEQEMGDLQNYRVQIVLCEDYGKIWIETRDEFAPSDGAPPLTKPNGVIVSSFFDIQHSMWERFDILSDLEFYGFCDGHLPYSCHFFYEIDIYRIDSQAEAGILGEAFSAYCEILRWNAFRENEI